MVNIRYFSLVNLIPLFLLLGACTQAMVPVEDATVAVEEDTYPEEIPPVTKSDVPEVTIQQPAPIEERNIPADGLDQGPVQHKASQAVIALLNEADHQVSSGNHQQAEATLERALRIDPKNPVLWHKLGRLHLQEGDWQTAISMAKKSNVLSQGNRALQADNWLMIAHARKALGDKQGTTEAMNQAARLRQQ